MSENRASSGYPWSIVLSGGEGERLASFVESTLGERRPKQYCAFTGNRTMLEQTISRALKVVSPRRLVTVIGSGHGKYTQDLTALPGLLIEQPVNRGTAAGILLAATYVRARDPEATLLIFPSDHFVSPERTFIRHVSEARLLADMSGKLVILAAEPDAAEPDYGWIVPRRTSNLSVCRVARFYEKPSPEQAKELFASGGLWNTMTIAVSVQKLWSVAHQTIPGVLASYNLLLKVVQAIQEGHAQPQHEKAVLEHIYSDMKPVDFSRHIVQRSLADVLALRMRGLVWSDWGRPERIEHSLSRLKRGIAAIRPVPKPPPPVPQASPPLPSRVILKEVKQ